MLFAALVLCLVGITLAQEPRPCTSPPKWEGRIFDFKEEEERSAREEA